VDESEMPTYIGADHLAELLDEAVEITRKAGELTLEYFGSSGLTIDLKADGSPVTQADLRAEQLIRSHLGLRHPDDGIFGEEQAEKPSRTGRRWIVDPIDGTLAFTHGVGLYSNLLALEDEEGIALGVINMPFLGETVYAARGLGCFCNAAPARVSQRDDLSGSYLSTSCISNWEDAALVEVNRAGVELRTWGDGFGYALVATGRVEAMVDKDDKLYDLAPMPVIIGEAGGCFTDLSGEPTPYGGSGLATNGHLHDAFMGLLSAS